MAAAPHKEDRSSAERKPADEWDALKDDVGHLAQEAKAQGWHFADIARAQARGYAEGRKDDVAHSVSGFARSLREATQTFDDRPNIQAITESAAAGLDQLADSIEEKTITEIVQDVEDAIRRHPLATATLSLSLGFFVARFLKSTAPAVDKTLTEGRARRPRRKTNSGSKIHA
ncbi:hypothetical protein [Microvirga flavescens]|uniref:hypothetical protein n=1 Tax=Microvirga flavescens TaxID=2249811 RepID=UPI000DD71F66|nr:hypothetical protein [Microvirga flavescens]